MDPSLPTKRQFAGWEAALDPNNFNLLSILKFRHTKDDFSFDVSLEHTAVSTFVSYVAKTVVDEKWIQAASALSVEGVLKQQARQKDVKSFWKQVDLRRGTLEIQLLKTKLKQAEAQFAVDRSLTANQAYLMLDNGKLDFLDSFVAKRKDNATIDRLAKRRRTAIQHSGAITALHDNDNVNANENVTASSRQNSSHRLSSSSDVSVEILTEEHLQSFFERASVKGESENLTKTKLASGTVLESVMGKWGLELQEERYVHSWILLLDDNDIRMRFSREDRKELRKIWQQHSTAFQYFSTGIVPEEMHKRSDKIGVNDETACYQFLQRMSVLKDNGLNVEELWNVITAEPVRLEGETRSSHPRAIALRQVMTDFLNLWIDNKRGGILEADYMKNTWDLLFDRLSAGRFTVSAPEKTMNASKNRKLKQGNDTNTRGKMSDKSWKLSTGVEVAWQEAAKQGTIQDPRKFSNDMLKVLKGTKDMADFALQMTGRPVEVFGIVTSGHEARILSVVRIPSGVYLARTLVEMRIPESFACFDYLLSALKNTLKWLAAMDEIARLLEGPKEWQLDESDDEIEPIYPTMQTPNKVRVGVKKE